MHYQHERGTAAKRHLDWIKAIRKKKISDRYCIIVPYYDNLHQYSKNKIHCSCPLCRAKTSEIGPGINDIRKRLSMDDQLKEVMA